ncbi:glutathione S-transferase [Mesorhizobium sp. ANAO-SY3R2]|uniref:glutathione S-transferase n=1 Tax=Mesorhizobium sp. ANAO-SY3R2 TaxID=3166644 RepID=UPI00366E7A33
MFKLFYSPASPYVRKVMVAAIERGVEDRIELLKAAASPIRRDNTIVSHNPTGKVPTAVLPDGRALFDSRVICQYVDAMAGSGVLYPSGERYFDVLTLEALADGLLDAAILLRYETMLRPDALRWTDWMQGQSDKIDSSLAALEGGALDTLEASFHAGSIAVSCALGYLDFRFANRNWRASAPKLRSWFEAVSTRPSLSRTVPSAA